MCGIAGILAEADLDPHDLTLLSRVHAGLRHRGPSSDGLFAEGPVALSMQRLAIIDLAGGQQPLFSEDGNRVLICNGEIYNHKELREELLARGHRPSSRSDVETILHLHEDLGLRALDRLEGMFAFALYERDSRRLTLGRDRLGEKPLYLWRDRRADGARRLWFSSELRALLAVIPPPLRRLSPRALAQFLTFQYLIEPQTPLEGLTQLPPGHVLEVSPDRLHEAEPRAYWRLADVPALQEMDPVGFARAALDTACLRMGSADVPVGVALSGGIDSSLVAALAARHYPGQIHAFSVGYTGRPETDERSIAARFAARLGIPFTEVELDTASIAADFPALVAAMDTPVADIAASGYYAVSKAARKAGIPVLMSGLGGDEMFWGYDWTRQAAQRIAAGPGLLERLAAPWRRPETAILAHHPQLKAGAAFAAQLLGDAVPADHWLAETRPDPALPPGLAVMDIVNRTWLLGNCLTLLDRISMAHSIEMRLPFLDVPLITGVTGLRLAGLDDHAKPHKWLLLSAHGDLLPDEISQRRKQGFTPPVGAWLAAINAATAARLGPDGPLARCGIVDPARLAALRPELSPEHLYRLGLYATWLEAIAAEPS